MRRYLVKFECWTYLSWSKGTDVYKDEDSIHRLIPNHTLGINVLFFVSVSSSFQCVASFFCVTTLVCPGYSPSETN